MKKFLLAGVSLSAFIAGPAMAADMRVRAPVYKGPPPVVSYFSWTGCYVGGHVGGLWVKRDWSDATDGFNVGSHDANGWLGGAQLGCNYQTGAWVFGIQGDYAWADASGSSANLLNVGGIISSDVKNLSSVTGRVGYAWDRFLLYVKGGGAWEKDEYVVTAVVPVALTATGSQTRSGWTVGIGGEYAFTNNFTGFVEYNYYDFGNKSVSFVGPLANALANIEDTKSVVKIGLNWKFGKGPVVAAY